MLLPAVRRMQALRRAVDHWPAPGYADYSSARTDNAEDVAVASPLANRWYDVTLDAKGPYSGVSLSATYE